MKPLRPKLRDVPVDSRLATLGLGAAAQQGLRTGLSLEIADKMVENVIATYALPMGIAENFVINGVAMQIPMVIEEPSVVAACSFAAKLARERGGFLASSTEPVMIGQVQLLDVPDFASAQAAIDAAKPSMLTWLNEHNPATQSKHAHAVDVRTRVVSVPDPDLGGDFLVVHLLYHCGDAMGANLVNTACEALAPRLAELSGGRSHLRILSNYSTERMASASCVMPRSVLGNAVERIVEAAVFAEHDPYRAVTHNKGVMNGIDAVVLATGNDWRAVEAAAHAWAARDGRYASMTRWRATADGDLQGSITLPMAVGIVGGATRVHPAAQSALQIMGITTARRLAEVIVCVGLAQNFAALRALAGEGIQQGHMGLHARQIAIAAGATGAAVDEIAAQLVSEGRVRLERAKALLQQMQ